MHHCILSAFLCFPHVYPLGGILVFSRVILTRVYVLRIEYTFCIHDAALAILIGERSEPPLSVELSEFSLYSRAKRAQ